MHTTEEQWHVIPGFSLYEITRDGQVRNGGTGRILKASISVRGYPTQPLKNDDGQRKLPYLHTLLLTTFVRSKRPGEVCRHLDGDKLNHSLDNLRWGTETENMYDLVRHGNHAQAKKTHCPSGHPYDDANTYVLPSRPTARYCRECQRVSSAARARRRADLKSQQSVDRQAA